jgi:hypothetical protein
MTDRELMQMALDALDTLGAGTSYKTHNTAKALRDQLAQPNVSYSGNGTAGRENMTAPTGYFFQMPKPEWVGLTDEEFEEYAHWIYPEKLIELENLLKEKNT